MNLALLDSELFELPEIVEDKLTVPDEVLVCAFNARGNLLAGGCKGGGVVVWDFDTHGVARTMLAHTGRVTSVQWTRSSRKLLSSSMDGRLIVWDVLTSAVLHQLGLGGEVLHAVLHPRKRTLCLACVGAGAAGQAYLIPLHAGDERRVALMPPTESAAPDAAAPVDATGSAEGGAPAKRHALTAGCFSKDGVLVLVGTSRGAI